MIGPTKAQLQKVRERFSVEMQTLTCRNPGCRSTMLTASFMTMEDGTPAVEAMCLKCGTAFFLPRWRGNERNAEKLNAWRNIVLNNDERRCHICGSDIRVEAHHIIPVEHDTQGRYMYSPRNGVALCRRCHELVHGEWMKKYDRE